MSTGTLTTEDVADLLTDLGLNGTGQTCVYRSLSVPGRVLRDVSVLCTFVHLQKLELPHNELTDLSCLSHMPYLVTLDVSHNIITDYFNFLPLRYLQEANFSHNMMSEMKDLSEYVSLRKLNLDHNLFSEIRGLQNCECLTHLSLEHNHITNISGLDGLRLKELSLKANHIQCVENMETLKALQKLNLSCNKIQSLSGLRHLRMLGELSLEHNKVSDTEEASHLRELLLLCVLTLQGNPVQAQSQYRLAIIFHLQQLCKLDQQLVSEQEKVSAVNNYAPPAEVAAGRDHMKHVVYQLMQPQVLLDSTLPSLDIPYPMLVLTGPQACGKQELAHKLCHEFSELFAYGACHTTRSPYFGEVDHSDYHFVSDNVFQEMIEGGKFVETLEYDGHMYGLSWETVESAAREGLACCVHMELEGVLSLKLTHLEPRYVLLIPRQSEEYALRLRQQGVYSRQHIDTAVARIDLYVTVNRQRPGFFDLVIPCDDLEEAYATLKQAMHYYLSMEESLWSNREGSETTFTDLQGDVLAKRRMRDPFDPSSRNYCRKVEARMEQQSLAEAASIQKQQHLAWEALTGQKASTQTPEDRPSLSCPAAGPEDSGPAAPSAQVQFSSETEAHLDTKAESQHHEVAKEMKSVHHKSSSRVVLPPIPAGRRAIGKPT